MVDDEMNEDELSEGFSISEDDADESSEEESYDDPNTDTFDKAFLKDDDLALDSSDENSDAEEMFSVMYQEYDER